VRLSDITHGAAAPLLIVFDLLKPLCQLGIAALAAAQKSKRSGPAFREQKFASARRPALRARLPAT